MKLDKIKISGFKSIREQEIELSNLNVLIGANGAGKSNFVSVFELLREMMELRLQEYALRSGGADSLLFFGHGETKEIEILLRCGKNNYSFKIVPTADDGLFVKHESTGFNRQGIHLGEGHREAKLPEYARKSRPGFSKDMSDAIKSWKVYHFQDTSESAKVKKVSDINDNIYLRPDASNLAAFLRKLQLTSPGHYSQIRDTIRMVAPFFDDFLLRPMTENQDKIRLEWQERGSDRPFFAHYLSDGTLRFICLTTLLLQPEPPSTIIIDEPELGLHPYAITVLASMLSSTSETTQIIVSTQSVPLVNQMRPEDLLIVERENRATTIRRLQAAEVADWLRDFDGYYGLGDLWEKNVFGGRP
ncbi:MAG: AAA family ATPase [Candidatus Coatesbacteria bacterium]|nr:AAA family ATPase [Candidatus Coatesbacteria bacterium]